MKFSFAFVLLAVGVNMAAPLVSACESYTVELRAVSTNYDGTTTNNVLVDIILAGESHEVAVTVKGDYGSHYSEPISGCKGHFDGLVVRNNFDSAVEIRATKVWYGSSTSNSSVYENHCFSQTEDCAEFKFDLVDECSTDYAGSVSLLKKGYGFSTGKSEKDKETCFKAPSPPAPGIEGDPHIRVSTLPASRQSLC